MTHIGSRRVPNEGPLDARIYICGEAPGVDEVSEGRPFVGVSGQLLRNCVGRAGLAEDEIRFANLCQFRPDDNKFPLLLGSSELEAGIQELARDISIHRPNVIAALGNWPLYYLTGKSGKKGKGTGIGKWRGSILPCILPGCEGVKVVAGFHPAYVVRQRGDYPIFDADIKRVKEESAFPELNVPTYQFVIDPRGDQLAGWVNYLCASEYLAVDIETIKKSLHLLCISFSPNPGTAIVIPYNHSDFNRRDAVAQILASPAKKVFHNGGAFDIPILEGMYDLHVENYYWDTMVGQHVMWVELPKSLDYLCSIYTRQPYYKTAGRAEIPDDAKGWSEKFDRQALYEYNGTDTCVTAKAFEEQQKELLSGPPEWKKVFDFEMEQHVPAAAISKTGMLIDEDRRQQLKKILEFKWALFQFILDGLTGYKTNVNSTKALPRILYDKDKMGLPVRKNRDGSLTTDEDAIVSLISFVKDKIQKLKPGGNAVGYWKVRQEVLKLILLIRGIRKLLSSYINIQISDDHRARSVYKPTGTDTGRWAASKYLDGTGLNSQTYSREFIDIPHFENKPELQEILNRIMGEELEDKSEVDPNVETEEAVAI